MKRTFLLFATLFATLLMACSGLGTVGASTTAGPAALTHGAGFLAAPEIGPSGLLANYTCAGAGCTTIGITVATGDFFVILASGYGTGNQGNLSHARGGIAVTDSASDAVNFLGACFDGGSDAAQIWAIPSPTNGVTVAMTDVGYAQISVLVLAPNMNVNALTLGTCGFNGDVGGRNTTLFSPHVNDVLAAGISVYYGGGGGIDVIGENDTLTNSYVNGATTRVVGGLYRNSTLSGVNQKLNVTFNPPTVSYSSMLGVDIPLGLPNPTLTAVPLMIDLGQVSDVNYGITGGASPYTWTLEVNGSSTNLSGASGGTYAFTGLYVAVYTFYFNVTDSNLNTAGVTATVTVVSAFVATFNAAESTYVAGQTATFGYVLAGGVPPYTWTIEENGSSTNLTGAGGGLYYQLMPYAGTYVFYFNASDSGTSTAALFAIITVAQNITPSLNISQVNETNFTESFSNGTWTNVTLNIILFYNSSANCSGSFTGSIGWWSWAVGNDVVAFINATGVVSYEWNSTTDLNTTFYAGENIWVVFAYETAPNAVLAFGACHEVSFAYMPIPPLAFGITPEEIFTVAIAGTLLIAIAGGIRRIRRRQ